MNRRLAARVAQLMPHRHPVQDVARDRARTPQMAEFPGMPPLESLRAGNDETRGLYEAIEQDLRAAGCLRSSRLAHE